MRKLTLKGIQIFPLGLHRKLIAKPKSEAKQLQILFWPLRLEIYILYIWLLSAQRIFIKPWSVTSRAWALTYQASCILPGTSLIRRARPSRARISGSQTFCCCWHLPMVILRILLLCPLLPWLSTIGVKPSRMYFHLQLFFGNPQVFRWW